ncbi:COG1470 family protein [Thermococcus celer]|uniref:CARDB domain-containing protein n=1 Tax=Thermococcus celer Vu 13 = JCM 8558 TaxID=1293037 RepID=A0A218P4D0_THECE|nr:hypothetical protein [Thermococcus celer]ASI99790.1 hypothetical protein A3L02_09540 [Thermococcus celer Vu 13 = JCM 8558]
MKLRGLLLIILLIPILLPRVSAQSPLVIVPLNDEFSGVPGDTIVIPFQLRNLGNETVSNVTVYVTGPTKGFLYGSRVIREPIEPNGTISEKISIKILNVNPGEYNLTLVARAGSSYSEAKIKVHVKTFVDYTLRVDVNDEYIYGNNVTIPLRVTSRANAVIIGRLGYTLSRDGTVLERFATTIYLRPGESWVKELRLTKPEVGNYSVYFWANFGGVFKSKTAEFRVYQRNLGYDAYFENGAIYVRVYDEKGRGVSNISVKINGVSFKTDDDGTVSYLVDEPGTYELVLNLDGKVARTLIDVKKLFLSATQENETLLVRVVDSAGKPVPNVTVTASGPLGKDYSTTNPSGIAEVNLEKTGYGTLMLRAESSMYIGGETTVRVSPPVKPTTTSSTTTPTNIPSVTPTTPEKPPKNYGPLAAILLVSGLLLAGTSYAAFFRPIVREEMLEGYYFVKVKAPRLVGIDGFRFERAVNAVGVRATKGKAEVKDGAVVWEIEHLDPEEEAYLQVILG